MLYTVKLITEVSMDFQIGLNNAALDGITSELAELTEILALYYKIYKEDAPAVNGLLDNQGKVSTLNRMTNTVKRAASSVSSLGKKMYSKLNTFASVEVNKSKALNNIVVANMYFNMLFSQMEFQLKMVPQDTPDYKDKLNKIKTSEAYIAISSHVVPKSVSDALDGLIKNLTDNPAVVSKADQAGNAALQEEVAENESNDKAAVVESQGGSEASLHNALVSNTGGSLLREKEVRRSFGGNTLSYPFIVHRIVHFFQSQSFNKKQRRSKRKGRKMRKSRRKVGRVGIRL
jgi:hypothetical protein